MSGSLAELRSSPTTMPRSTRQSGGARQRGIGTNASGHDHHLAFQPRAVIEEEAADARGRRAPPWCAARGACARPTCRAPCGASLPRPRRAALPSGASQMNDWTSTPSSSSPRAASSPSKPPPMTAARRTSRAKPADLVAIVQRSKYEDAVAILPSVRHQPVERRTKGLLPVTMTSLSYGSPGHPRRRRACARGRCASPLRRRAARRRAPSYQARGLMKISFGSCVPARTPDRRMRL